MGFIADMNYSTLTINMFFSLAILLAGIFIGKGISYLLKKFSEKLDLNKKMRPSFIELIITLIRWSIYIIFFNSALNQLPKLEVIRIITKSLIVIPSFVGSIIIIFLSFIIASYLKTTVEEAHAEWKFLAMYLFYFVILIMGIFAFRVALFNINIDTLNYLTVIMSTLFVTSITVIYSIKAIKS